MPVTLGKVADFLVDTGLTYIEMLQVLECYFINPLVNGERSIKIVSTTAADQTTCKIEDLKLQTTSPQSLKVNPFIRLWKKPAGTFSIWIGPSPHSVLPISPVISTELIIPLSHIARLKARPNSKAIHIIAFWSNIDTAVIRPLGGRTAESNSPKLKTFSGTNGSPVPSTPLLVILKISRNVGGQSRDYPSGIESLAKRF